MFKHYVGIALSAVLVLIVIAVSFSIVGTPADERARNLDKARLSDFSRLKTAIQTYYSTNTKFPSSLGDLDGKPNYKDPGSGKEYEFKPGEGGKYELCTTFSTDSAETKKEGGTTDTYPSVYSLGFDADTTHSKGEDCIEYAIPSYYLNTGARNIYGMSPTPLPPQLRTVDLGRQIASTNNAKRSSDVNAILNAITQYAIDNKGTLPTGIATEAAVLRGPEFSELCTQLVPQYIAAMPVDPLLNNTPVDAASCSLSWNTGYTVQIVATTNRVRITAPRAELGAQIEVVR